MCKQILIVILFLSLLSLSSRFNPDQWYLAKGIEGEVRGVIGKAGAIAVGETVRNRVEAGEGSYEKVVRQRYHGSRRIRIPSPLYLHLAAIVLSEERTSHPCLVALSLQDMEYLGADPDQAYKLFGERPFQIGLWEDWMSWRK